MSSRPPNPASPTPLGFTWRRTPPEAVLVAAAPAPFSRTPWSPPRPPCEVFACTSSEHSPPPVFCSPTPRHFNRAPGGGRSTPPECPQHPAAHPPLRYLRRGPRRRAPPSRPSCLRSASSARPWSD
eukprot:scaffold1400_cov113-Isochrysis_galbana.AAC.6